jgi:hypothetical protein
MFAAREASGGCGAAGGGRWSLQDEAADELARRDAVIAAQAIALMNKDAALAANDVVISVKHDVITAQQATIAALFLQRVSDVSEAAVEPALHQSLAEAEGLETVAVASGATTACAS